ncbi:MAG: hypothetical protein L7F78_26925 [Syntrophales bacterium LBB04]|nr:hypothetical protein [Syntrophales bacterium LBB04]
MQTNYLATVLSIFVASLIFIPYAVADDATKGEINWVGGYVSGIGQATATPSGNKVKDRLRAQRAAEVLALRALAETTKGVRIDGETVVKDMMLVGDVVRARVEGVVKGAKKYKSDIVWEGDVPVATVEMRICLMANSDECKSDTSLLSILPVEQKKEPPYVPAEQYPAASAPAEKKELSPKPEAPTAVLPSYDTSRPVTGVVVSLGGRFFERELLPVIITEGGENKYQTVYSAKSVNPNVIRTYGVVRYADSLEQAVKNPYLGNNVMVVPAADVTKENMISIRRESASAIGETPSVSI